MCRGVGTGSEGVVVAVFGLAELVQEEDDRLQAQDQHDAPDEACRVEGGGLAGGRGWDHCGGAGLGAIWKRQISNTI